MWHLSTSQLVDLIIEDIPFALPLELYILFYITF